LATPPIFLGLLDRLVPTMSNAAQFQHQSLLSFLFASSNHLKCSW